MVDELVAVLRAGLGEDHVLTDVGTRDAHGTDWTGRFHVRPRCVVRPGSTAEVAAVVRACATQGVPVTPQGGNTGLVGGAVPVDGGVLLSTTRLDRLDAVDHAAGTVVAGAGVPLARLQAHAVDAGWGFGVDLASRDSATVGGLVATDAGGARVVLHGSTRAQVVGLELVLADGAVARPGLTGATKDTAGYDLAQLVVGSEGTLAVVTAARLRLVRPPTTAATLLLGVADADGISATVAALHTALDGRTVLAACEFMAADGMALAAGTQGVAVPVDTPWAVLVELAMPGGGAVPDDVLEAVADTAAGGATGGAVVLAVDQQDRRRLWALREGHAEAINRRGVPVKLDVAVPADRLGELLAAAPRVVEGAAPGAVTVLFGHAAEANCHVNVLPGGLDDGSAPTRDHDRARASGIVDAVLRLVGELGGTISAEHGVGREKVGHLHLTLDETSIAAIRAVKRALDPTGVLNPGVLLPDRRDDRGTGSDEEGSSGP